MSECTLARSFGLPHNAWLPCNVYNGRITRTTVFGAVPPVLVLSRAANDHDRASRPRPSPGPPSGPCAVRRERRPRRSTAEGSAMGSPPTAHRGDRSRGYGEASCWRGFFWARLRADGWQNGGIKTGRKQGRGPLAWRDRWRAANPSQTPLREQTCSPRQRTLSVSLQRMTCSPL